ncbi:MAG: hypothetical protein WDM84_09715 [Bauldia sp.]
MTLMVRIGFAFIMLTGVLLSPALAVQKEGSGGATVTCGCKCVSGEAYSRKQWTFLGTRADCQAFSDATCKWSTPAGNQTITGTLSDCDVTVQISKPPVKHFGQLPGTLKARP